MIIFLQENIPFRIGVFVKKNLLYHAKQFLVITRKSEQYLYLPKFGGKLQNFMGDLVWKLVILEKCYL